MEQEYTKLNLIKAGYKGEFNSDSIINEIPATIKTIERQYHFSIDKLDGGPYLVGYWCNMYEEHRYDNKGVTLFEALSKIWIELKEDGFIK